MRDGGDALVSRSKRALLMAIALCLIGLSGAAGWYWRGVLDQSQAVAAQAELPPEALADADSFIAALAGLPQPVAEARLLELVAAFQVRQDALHPPVLIDGADYADAAEEHETLTLDTTGPYFVLQIMRVEQAHTARYGIDGGVDSYRSIILDKATLQPLADLPGPVHAFGNPALRLSLPARNDCLGLVPSGELEVYDLRAARPIFRTHLADGIVSTGEPDQEGPETLRFTTHREEGFDDGKEHHCDVGDWVRKFDTVFALRCDSKAGKCALEEVSVEVSAGCQDIGGCD
ncbi:hypothetical protein GCM10027046_22680 [Uliginosibacterium flavum]